MKAHMKKIMVTALGAGLLILAGLGATKTYAAEIGSGAVEEGNEYTLEEMLTYAIEDEYIAYAEYEALIEKFGDVRPFSNIIKAEAHHIEELLPLFATYGFEVPEKDWSSYVALPETLEEAYEIGVEAEVKNIGMYEQFLSQDLPDDVREVFEDLKAASEKHLAAFSRQVDKTSGTSENQSGQKSGSAQGSGSGQGNRGSGNGTRSCE